MTSLRDRAAAAANGTSATEPASQSTHDAPPPLDPIEYTDPIIDVETVPVHQAWARVMRDVKSVGRSQTANVNIKGGGSYQYKFRGIDLVLNAVGPALRRHGVMILPVRTDASYGRASTSGGGGMRECTVTVTYRIVGPAGDHLEIQSVGEGLDTSDKATPKALTMAYRMLLINALSLPTEDPSIEGDNTNLQRAEAPAPKAADYVDEVADHRTSPNRLRQIRAEVRQHNLGAVLITNETGDDERLLSMIDRIGKDRAQAGGQP